jgi:putative FmdB family regulatory protein
VAIYDLRCAQGHEFEVIQSFTAPLPLCATCGAATAKLPSRISLRGGSATALPPAHDRLPQTWRGTFDGDRDYVTDLRRTAEARRALEDRHPELAGDRRPVLAHEGPYEQRPLRAGDPVPAAHQEPGPGHPHPHPHPHGAAHPSATTTDVPPTDVRPT